MSFRSLRTPLVTSLFVSSLSASAWWGCSDSGDTSGFQETGGGSSTNSNAGGSNAGGAGNSTSIGGGFNVDGGGDVIDENATCAADEVDAEPIQLDMVILLDESGSMTGQKWDGSIQALKTFVNDPASAGIAVGFLVFPVDNGGCNLDDYKQLLVPIDVLPQNAAPLVAAFDAEDTQGGTPMYGGLYGALSIATAHQDANPDHKVVVVLATDGDPNGCAINDIPGIAGLASSALNYNGVETYTIAIQGSNLATLNTIAAAGGTGQTYDVTANIQAFSQKMEEIRTNALSCEFILPEPPRGEQLDPEKVNVNYTPGGIGMPQKIPQAANAGDCGATPGWYYDNPAMPTKIFLCPASCNIIKADKEAKLNVAFGCKTEVN